MEARGETQRLAELLESAAAMLARETAGTEAAARFLSRLGYDDGAVDAVPHRVSLLRAAAKFRRIFSLRAEDAPGLIALGAEVDAGCLGVRDAPAGGVSGTGLTFRQAFESCVGEGVEFLSQFAMAGDPLVSLSPDEALTEATRALWDRLQPYRRNHGAARIDWMAGADLADGSPVWLPADLCLRRPPDVRDLDPPWPLSTGCGAGPDPLSATLHGLLELIERDAVALWLRGGARGRIVPPGIGGPLLDRLRGQARGRRTWLLDITSDIGVPVVAALACNADGLGVCRGFACRPTLALAADAALMELAQMELAYGLSATKRSVRGDDALNDADRQHIRRYTEIDAAGIVALQPLAPPAISCDLLEHDNIGILGGVRKRLEAVGVGVYAVNLSRPAFEIPVTRTIAPGLEMGLTSPPGPRVRAKSEQTSTDLGAPVFL